MFTKGDWIQWSDMVYSENGVICQVSEPEQTTIRHETIKLSSKKWDEAIANAKLIAAAPDLLKALEAILLDWNDATIPHVYRGKPGAFDVATQRIAKARSAVAKARSE